MIPHHDDNDDDNDDDNAGITKARETSKTSRALIITAIRLRRQVVFGCGITCTTAEPLDTQPRLEQTSTGNGRHYRGVESKLT